MFRRSHCLHLDGSCLTAYNTDATAEAFLGINDRLQPFTALKALHLYGIELAALNTVLTTSTIVNINISLIAALLPDHADGKVRLVYDYVILAAVTTALATGVNASYIGMVRPYVEELKRGFAPL